MKPLKFRFIFWVIRVAEKLYRWLTYNAAKMIAERYMERTENNVYEKRNEFYKVRAEFMDDGTDMFLILYFKGREEKRDMYMDNHEMALVYYLTMGDLIDKELWEVM